MVLDLVLLLVLAILILMDLIILYDKINSNNFSSVLANHNTLYFAFYLVFQDLIIIFMVILRLSIFVYFMSNILNDIKNYIMANLMQTLPTMILK